MDFIKNISFFFKSNDGEYDTSFKFQFGDSLLHLAVKDENKEKIKEILDKTLDGIDEVNAENLTP